MTNRVLLVLPDDLPLYRLPGETTAIDPDDFPIADAARMSMSIPYFFEPVLARPRPGDGAGRRRRRRARRRAARRPARRGQARTQAVAQAAKAATYRELTAEERRRSVSTIVDGGTLSNFPVWLFDVDTANSSR